LKVVVPGVIAAKLQCYKITDFCPCLSPPFSRFGPLNDRQSGMVSAIGLRYGTIMPRVSSRHRLFIATLILLVPLLSSAYGLEQDETLLLLEGEKMESISTSRAPKPISQSAENITILTNDEIEALNAHTLADLLASVSGVQIESIRTPGSLNYLRLQGTGFGHVQVMLDGVPINNLGENFADIGLVPARIIERIEIVKGAASSAWGQGLGGVINVITKGQETTERPVGGLLSTSHGENGTSDTGGELGGEIDRIGYFLSAGYLSSDGLLPNNHTRLSNGYAKLSYDLPGQGQITTTFTDVRGKRGDFAYPAIGVQEDSSPRMSLMTFALRQPVADRLELEVGGRYLVKKYHIDVNLIQNADSILRNKTEDRTVGFSSRLIWRSLNHMLVAGAEYDYVKHRESDSLANVVTARRKEDRWGAYLNDTIQLGQVTISPGIRYDLAEGGDEQLSPSLGLTWQLSDKNLLRVYAARGYSLPPLLSDQNSEKVFTAQVGLESSALNGLWLKGTIFRNDTWDIFVRETFPNFHLERQIKQGVELEVRTLPWHGTTISGGYTFIDARVSGNHETVQDIPSQTVQLGLLYDDLRHLRAMLTGKHIWWKAAPNHLGHYNAMIWDLHMTAFPLGREPGSAEIFFSIRNLFNGSSYLDDAFRNTGRWIETGVRFRF